MNRISLVGRLTRDPNCSTASNGTAITKFTIAVRKSVQKEGQPEAEFIDIVTFKAVAENCAKYLKKGREIALVGELQSSLYTDKDGIQKKSWSVLGSEVEFLSPASDNKTPKEEKTAEPAQLELEPVADDVVPF